MTSFGANRRWWNEQTFPRKNKMCWRSEYHTHTHTHTRSKGGSGLSIIIWGQHAPDSRGGNDNPLQYSCLKNPTEEPGRQQSMGWQRVRHDWMTEHAYTHMSQTPSNQAQFLLWKFLACFQAPNQFSSVQSLSCVRLFTTPWIAAHQASLSITNSRSSLRFMSIESVMPSHPLSSPSPLAPNPSHHQSLFQWVNSSYDVAKVLEFQL